MYEIGRGLTDGKIHYEGSNKERKRPQWKFLSFSTSRGLVK